MRRTAIRPLPSKRMSVAQATIISAVMIFGGAGYLALTTNLLTVALTLGTSLIYLAAYTPLKKVSPICTFIGAIPGALPPLLGWVAARGVVEREALVLFAIVFCWQFPHFYSIAWMYREDYSRAGFRMISSDDRTGERSASQSVFFCILLLVIAGLPTFLGIANFVYLGIELLLGCLFIVVAMRFLRMRTASAARLLFLASIIYLPLLLGALVLTKS
jgi:protoheme IX farnesyltransferase